MTITPNSNGEDNAPLREHNTCHTPGGSSKGGQFCSKAEAAPRPAGGPDDEAAWFAHRDRERAWDAKIRTAVSVGDLTPEQATALGWYGDSNAQKGYQPLPPVLYHVSTGFNEILRTGLKTRAEIGGENRGLGGGSDETISFTADLATARGIRAAILEARRVVRGEITPAQMIRMAKNQPERLAQTARAKYMQQSPDMRNAYEMLVSFYNGKTWHKGDPMPRSLQTVLKGVIIERVHDSKHPTIQALSKLGGAIAVKDLPKGVTPFGQFKGRDEVFTMQIVRKMTRDEQLDAAFEMYKRYATAREYAGGRMDPLFFTTSREALARVKVKDIKIMAFKPRSPKARGYQVSALGEWRVHTGKAVRYTGTVESA